MGGDNLRSGNFIYENVCLEDIILDTVIKKTIYKDEELEELFEFVRKKYDYFGKEKVEEAIKEVRVLLES